MPTPSTNLTSYSNDFYFRKVDELVLMENCRRANRRSVTYDVIFLAINATAQYTNGRSKPLKRFENTLRNCADICLQKRVMMAKKIGRNSACPCGSGKKYKRCCLGRGGYPPETANPPEKFLAWYDESDDLDIVSNRVTDEITAGFLDKAEASCKELFERWPNQIDHLACLASVREAQNRRDEAAELYRKAAEHARTRSGFDREIVDDFLRRAANCEKI